MIMLSGIINVCYFLGGCGPEYSDHNIIIIIYLSFKTAITFPYSRISCSLQYLT